jgi:chromosome segregation protein
LRLAHIKLAGFKSFVDPTAIPVSQDLVGIVGPNGCGKSNIIDAVRWVLGESKASALRGDSMQDVIFAGSDNRKAIGRASVEIVFENHASKAIGQWSSYAEIAIKRVLQRDGVSSYYINNLPVRRRDISDIFLGTGVGGRGYAIIEQGMISRIIDAKPLELRSFLEEAAGISQYRERRHETSLRLIDTRKNLTRLEDICRELAGQLHHLEAQAETARHFQLLQEKLHTAQALLWLQRRDEAIHQCTLAEKDIQQLETELDIALSNQHNAEKAYEETRTKEYAINDQLLQIQGQLYSADAEIGRVEQEIHFLNNTRERLAQQLREIDHQLERSKQIQHASSENLIQWHQEKAKAELAHQQHIEINNEAVKKLPKIEAEFHRCQAELSKCKHHLLLTEQANQLEESHLNHATKNIQQLETRHSRLLKEQTELAAIDQPRLIALESEISQIDLALQAEQQKHLDMQSQLSAAIQLKQTITNEIQELQHALSQATARFKALQNLQQKLDNNQNLSSWLKKQQLDALPRLWQKIQIQPEWENALEAVLRERLNSIEVEQIDSIQNLLNNLPSGKWTLFENIQTAFPEHTQSTVSDSINGQKLIDHVTTHQPEIQHTLADWLGSTYVVTGIQEGLSKRSQLYTGEILVTPEGHIITRTSLTFYAPDTQLHGVLSRQQELKNIQKEIDQLESLLQKQHALLEDAKHDNTQLTEAIHASNLHSKQIQQRRHDLQLELVKLSQINERTTHRNQQISSELTEIKQALDHEISLLESAKAKLTNNLEQIDTLKKHKLQAQAAWEAANQLLANQRHSVQQSTKQLQEAVFQIKTCQSKIDEIEHTAQSVLQDLQTLSQNHSDLLKEQESLDTTSLNNQLETLRQQRKSIEQTALQVRQAVEDTAKCLREIESTRMASEQKSYALKETVNQLRLKAQAASITATQFNDLIREAKIDADSLSPLLGKKSVAALQTEINRLNTDINKLGPVNLAALEELENARARESTLISQLQDLNEAIMTLENVIQQIDRETQIRLQETFDKVNQYLSEIFPVIFAGGQARLELCDGKILDAGLLLMAQPPGKKNSSIHLLSGGEKALTALALIFSLFRLNPAPFCLLDEVDAPLDDSNTGRFCELVKNMSKQTQFLFISHNKITMEMAQQLIGVTMQEQGVSRIVAVDIADAIKMGKRDKQPVIQ